jgi:hypothetical protein
LPVGGAEARNDAPRVGGDVALQKTPLQQSARAAARRSQRTTASDRIMSRQQREHAPSIWLYALGYFLCYAPYSALTKAVSLGRVPGAEPVSGFALLPVSTAASLVGMFLFISAMGWWRHASRRVVLGRSVPCPGPWTFLSGLCSAAIIGTTTLAYTLSGVSIVFMMLLMRGGVLVIAPLVDVVSGRRVRWFSWTALLLSLASLGVALSEPARPALTAVAAADVALYLLGYFVRLRFMSRLAKSGEPAATTRYFVEEQMVATPAIVSVLALCALAGGDGILGEIRAGFIELPRDPGALAAAVGVGLLSQGTGIFGGLILLDRRENTFCVPVNRASSVLAGLVASASLSSLLGLRQVPASELLGAGFVVAAILVLALPGLIEARRRSAAGRPGVPAVLLPPAPPARRGEPDASRPSSILRT